MKQDGKFNRRERRGLPRFGYRNAACTCGALGDADLAHRVRSFTVNRQIRNSVIEERPAASIVRACSGGSVGLNSNHEAFTIVHGESPLIAAAVHDGHEVRPDVAAHLALADRDRRREEDPFTATWTTVSDSRIVARRSRFEVDLNRSRDRAVYRRPEDAWGVDVWKGEPPTELLERSLKQYDDFYAAVEDLLADKARRHGRFVVYDLHSYNHMRNGADAEPADAESNPEVNIGTGSMDRDRRSRLGRLHGKEARCAREREFRGRRLSGLDPS
jgi:hypothetical protein